MGLTPEADLDLLAAYAIDATEPDDDLLLAAQLAGSASLTATELDLRAAGIAYADAVLVGAGSPPPTLRAAVLAAAFAVRPGIPVVPTRHEEAFLAESHHLLATLRSLHHDDFARLVDPPELAGWTVADLVAHVASNQALAAEQLGVGDPSLPERDQTNEGRTAIVQERHRAAGVARSVDELAHLTDRIEARIAAIDDHELRADVSYWGMALQVDTLLLHRAFEIWIHHRDICRTTGRPDPVTSSRSLAAMSRQAAEWTPMFLNVADVDTGGGTAVLDLTGDGGARHQVALGFGEVPDTAAEHDPDPRFTLRMDVRHFCLAIGARSPDGGFPFEATGDVELATALVRALPILAAV